MKHLIKRLTQSTPTFFIKLRNTGVVISAIGVGLIAEPVQMPTFILAIAEHLVVAGAIIGIISQATVKDDQ